MGDPHGGFFIVRYSEHLAARVEREVPGEAHSLKRVGRLYELALNRLPTPEEARALSEYAGRHGFSNACRVVLNSNEFMFVN